MELQWNFGSCRDAWGKLSLMLAERERCAVLGKNDWRRKIASPVFDLSRFALGTAPSHPAGVTQFQGQHEIKRPQEEPPPIFAMSGYPSLTSFGAIPKVPSLAIRKILPTSLYTFNNTIKPNHHNSIP